MTDRTHLIPGPDHPITIAPAGQRIVVRADGVTIADTAHALRLQEATYPPVLYVPRADADMAVLTRTDHTTWCPYKGEASYYSLPAGVDRAENAIWTYETPFDAVADIAGHLAFYPDRVEIIEMPHD